MTDIVERLRKFCKWPEPGDGIPNDPVFANVPDLKEAADEIERLRAEVARCEASLLAWIEAVGECNRDRNRLRATLLALTIHEEANARREGLEPCREAQEARALLEDGR